MRTWRSHRAECVRTLSGGKIASQCVCAHAVCTLTSWTHINPSEALWHVAETIKIMLALNTHIKHTQTLLSWLILGRSDFINVTGEQRGASKDCDRRLNRCPSTLSANVCVGGSRECVCVCVVSCQTVQLFTTWKGSYPLNVTFCWFTGWLGAMANKSSVLEKKKKWQLSSLGFTAEKIHSIQNLWPHSHRRCVWNKSTGARRWWRRVYSVISCMILRLVTTESANRISYSSVNFHTSAKV